VSNVQDHFVASVELSRKKHPSVRHWLKKGNEKNVTFPNTLTATKMGVQKNFKAIKVNRKKSKWYNKSKVL
jgi:hypothetical protein